MDKHTQIIRQQFQVLLDRANKRFGKLRELQTRADLSWAGAQALFHKTFDCFSRLWQFQLANRAALLESGLQRCELGAIANKIGQLYYNYYLRSGDTGALLESYTFYDAVHTRQYFAPPPPPSPASASASAAAAAAAGSPAAGGDAAAASARLMRFYARFVVVCLFLNRREEAMQLLQELQACVSSYMLQYGSYSPDATEWQLVVNEVSGLLTADQLARPLPRSPLPSADPPPYTPPLRCRLTDPAAACAPHRPRLHEAILVSYRPRQIKVAELPLELYRMAQALEWGQQGGAGAGQGQAAAAAGPVGPGARPMASAAKAEAATPESGGEGRDGRAPGPQGPSAAVGSTPSSSAAPSASTAVTAGAGGGGPHRNPPRQLLHRPSAQRLLSALLGVTAALEPAAAGEQFMLLYISADAAPAAASGPETRSAAAVVAAAPPPSQRQLLLCPPPHHHHHHSTKQQPLAPAAVAAAPTGPGATGAELSAAAAGGQQQHLQVRGTAAAGAGPSGSGGGGNGSGGGGGRGAGAAAASASSSASTSDGLLWPAELLCATRRRVLLLLDSDMGPDFARLMQGRERGFPLLCLSAPPCQALTAAPGGPLEASAPGATGPSPAPSQHPPPPPPLLRGYGSLTSMALSCPAQALCALVGQPDPQPGALQRLQEVLDEALLQLGAQLADQLATSAASAAATAAVMSSAATAPTGGAPSGANPCAADEAAASGAGAGSAVAVAPSSSSPPPFTAWSPVFEDCLSRRLLLHFALYRACVQLHPLRSRDPDLAPTAFPPLPPAADPTNPLLRRAVRRAAELLGRPGAFGGGDD